MAVKTSRLTQIETYLREYRKDLTLHNDRGETNSVKGMVDGGNGGFIDTRRLEVAPKVGVYSMGQLNDLLSSIAGGIERSLGFLPDAQHNFVPLTMGGAIISLGTLQFVEVFSEPIKVTAIWRPDDPEILAHGPYMAGRDLDGRGRSVYTYEIEASRQIVVTLFPDEKIAKAKPFATSVDLTEQRRDATKRMRSEIVTVRP